MDMTGTTDMNVVHMAHEMGKAVQNMGPLSVVVLTLQEEAMELCILVLLPKEAPNTIQGLLQLAHMERLNMAGLITAVQVREAHTMVMQLVHTLMEEGTMESWRLWAGTSKKRIK